MQRSFVCLLAACVCAEESIKDTINRCREIATQLNVGWSTEEELDQLATLASEDPNWSSAVYQC